MATIETLNSIIWYKIVLRKTLIKIITLLVYGAET